MRNCDKFKTAEERANAFDCYCEETKCKNQCDDALSCRECQFAWLDRKAEEEKPLPCPLCGGTYFNIKIVGQYSPRFRVDCGCGYCGGWKESESDAIAAHNRVAKAVMDAKREVE